MSPTYCILPWSHIFAGADGQLLSCCMGLDKSMGKAKDGIVAQMNSPLMKDIRRAMIEGRWHPNCQLCKEREQVGAKSSRTTANLVRRDHVTSTATTLPDGTLPDPKMLFMDLRFSNLCNFKCRSCSFRSSSAWYDEEKALYGELDLPNKVVESGIDMEELKTQLPYVKSIDFLGGEPLMDKPHRKVLQWLSDHKRFDVRLNLSPPRRSAATAL